MGTACGVLRMWWFGRVGGAGLTALTRGWCSCDGWSLTALDLRCRAKVRPASPHGAFSVPSSVHTGILGGTACRSRKRTARL